MNKEAYLEDIYTEAYNEEMDKISANTPSPKVKLEKKLEVYVAKKDKVKKGSRELLKTLKND